MDLMGFNNFTDTLNSRPIKYLTEIRHFEACDVFGKSLKLVFSGISDISVEAFGLNGFQHAIIYNINCVGYTK